MSKFDILVSRLDDLMGVSRKDRFDRFMWNNGKWFLVLVAPFIKQLWWYKWMAQPTVWIWVMFLITYAFCLFFCFIDLYKWRKKIMGVRDAWKEIEKVITK